MPVRTTLRRRSIDCPGDIRRESRSARTMPTAPYSAAVWKKVLECSDAVEALLTRNAVQLTMGGEPTFVPVAPEGAEWQTAALGPTKLGYARKFAHELIRTVFRGAV